jgi:hypothetical protein
MIGSDLSHTPKPIFFSFASPSTARTRWKMSWIRYESANSYSALLLTVSAVVSRGSTFLPDNTYNPSRPEIGPAHETYMHRPFEDTRSHASHTRARQGCRQTNERHIHGVQQ